MIKHIVTSAPLLAAAGALALPQSLPRQDDASLPDLSTLGNNTLFNKWRPTVHFLGPNSWMNDPCAPYFDEETQKFHFSYQYYAEHVSWGNISWGHATSEDMITWTDVPAPNIPGSSYLIPTAFVPDPSSDSNPDKLGIFSGGAFPDGKGGWAILYTGVNKLPTFWRSEYLPDTETVNLAHTSDNGLTWNKYEGNPIVPSPSSYWNITGWRDPLAVFEADALREHVQPEDWEGTAYFTLGSGLKSPEDQAGGRVLLYKTVDPTVPHLTKWEYVGPLFHANINESWDGDQGWSGNYGGNFEMSGLLQLEEPNPPEGEEPQKWWAVHHGVEGLFPPDQPRALVTMGDLKKREDGSVELVPFAVTPGDFGATYATNHFHAPPSSLGGPKRKILLGWLPEALNSTEWPIPRALGYQGSLVLPRELFIRTLTGVTSAAAAETNPRKSWTSTPAADGKYTVRSLGVRPVKEVERVREGAAYRVEKALAQDEWNVEGRYGLGEAGASFELKARIEFGEGAGKAGLVLRRSETTGEETVVYYDLEAEELRIDRSRSSAYSFDPAAPLDAFAKFDAHGKFRLWEVDGKRQALELRVFVDNSIIEVYANDGFVLSARIYPWAEDARGIALWNQNSSATFSDIEIWDGLAKAWPARAENTSVPLKWDGEDVPWDGF